MLYIIIENDKAARAISSAEFNHAFVGKYETRNDWRTFEQAQQRAHELNSLLPGRGSVQAFLAIDSGPNVGPRYDIILRPMIGDAVSYSFNGDTYPDGYVKKISDSLRIVTTTTGARYYRRRQTGAWVKGGTWTLVRGHRNERNPSF